MDGVGEGYGERERERERGWLKFVCLDDVSLQQLRTLYNKVSNNPRSKVRPG